MTKRLSEVPLEDFIMLTWLPLLGETRNEQLEAVRDLLRHAQEDEMSVEDRHVCVLALHHLTRS